MKSVSENAAIPPSLIRAPVRLKPQKASAAMGTELYPGAAGPDLHVQQASRRLQPGARIGRTARVRDETHLPCAR